MTKVAVFLIIVFVWLLTESAAQYDRRIAEIMGMAMMKPFLFMAIALPLLYLYDGFKKKENEERRELDFSSASLNDLFLVPLFDAEQRGEYKVIDAEGGVCFQVCCTFLQQRLEALSLLPVQFEKTTDLQLLRENNAYLVLEAERLIGRIRRDRTGWSFILPDESILCSAKSECLKGDGLGAVSDALLSFETLSVYSSASKTDKLLFCGRNEAVLGAYYPALRNIDLSGDDEQIFDRRIAVLLAIIFEHEA